MQRLFLLQILGWFGILLLNIMDRIREGNMDRSFVNYTHCCASRYASENTMLSFYLGIIMDWGVTDEQLMQAAYDAGVDGMTVNFPDKLRAYIKEKSNG